MNQVDKKYMILGSLCALVLMLVVGYAAFSTLLNIKGTSNISSNWDIKITSITSNVLHGTPSNAIEPTGVGTLTATFETNLVSPGDSMQYVITITNNGSMNAILEKITVSKPNNDAITFENSGLTEGSTLTSKGTADLIVTVTYKDIAEGQKQPDNTKGTLSVTLDYVQEGTSTVTPTDNVVYRWTEDSLKTGDSIEGIETTEDYTTLGKSFFLKHNVTDGIIKSSEVCFIKNGLHCLIGGDNGVAFETNKTTLRTAFGESACYVYGSSLSCPGGSLFAGVSSDGGVRVNDGAGGCDVYSDGESYCI